MCSVPLFPCGPHFPLQPPHTHVCPSLMATSCLSSSFPSSPHSVLESHPHLSNVPYWALVSPRSSLILMFVLPSWLRYVSRPPFPHSLIVFGESPSFRQRPLLSPRFPSKFPRPHVCPSLMAPLCLSSSFPSFPPSVLESHPHLGNVPYWALVSPRSSLILMAAPPS